jgi:O-antigen/teichoic acid export membrane protein
MLEEHFVEVGTGVDEAANAGSAPEGEQAGDRDLIRRAPSGFLWYQAFIFWLFISNWLVGLVIRRTLPLAEAGTYGLVIGAANLTVYLASLGLGNAASVFLPRALAEEGPGRAMAVAVRLIATRIAAVAVLAVAILWGLPLVTALLATANLPGSADLVHGLRDPLLTSHRIVLVIYLVAFGMANLLAALLTALLRTRTVFFANSVVQLATIALTYYFVAHLHAQADGAIYAQALPVMLAAVVYAVALRRILANHQRSVDAPPMGPILRLGIATALTDLANNSLLSLIAQAQLLVGMSAALLLAGHTAAFAANGAKSQVALFTAALQLGHAAALVGVEGLGGVSIAIMSAAFAKTERAGLATAWRTVVKLHVLLAVPLVVFCMPHATVIMQVLYTDLYTDAGPLLALFLGLTAVVQLAGGGSHEPALYVLGRQRWAVISRWGSLSLLALGDVLLIPHFGPAGALVAVGVAQIAAEVFQLVVVRRMVARRYPLGFIWRLLLAMILPTAVTVLWRPTSLLGLVVAGLLYAALFITCLWFIKPLDSEDGQLLRQLRRPLRRLLEPFVADGARAAVTDPEVASAPALATLARDSDHPEPHD